MIQDIARILAVAQDWPANELQQDPGAYRLGYTALRKLFDTHLDYRNVDDVRIGGYAVYGWMPRLLRVWASDDTLLSLGRLAVLARTRPRAEVRHALDEQFAAGHSPFQAFNNSAVGTSKFLHFAAPHVFPIWDSVVAGNFGLTTQVAISRQSHYVHYFDAIHTCIEGNAETRELLRTLLLPNVTDVRSLEYVLFLNGLKLHSARRQPTPEADC